MKRHLLIIATSLLLGAVVNVAVAWACAAWIYQVGVDSFGWPVRSLDWDYWDSPATGPRYGYVLPRDPDLDPLTYEPGLILPLRPIWPGFTVNTIFYAAALWLLIPGPFALRRFLRVRRGLCPACAYPMGESSVCTECGGSLAKHAAIGFSGRIERGSHLGGQQTEFHPSGDNTKGARPNAARRYGTA